MGFLWLVVIALFILWALGAFVVNFGGLVHLLLVIVLVLVIFNLVSSMGGHRRRG